MGYSHYMLVLNKYLTGDVINHFDYQNVSEVGLVGKTHEVSRRSSFYVNSDDHYGLPKNHDALFKNKFKKAITSHDILQTDRHFLVKTALNVMPTDNKSIDVFVEMITPLKNKCELTQGQIKNLVKEVGYISGSGETYRSENFITEFYKEALNEIFSDN